MLDLTRSTEVIESAPKSAEDGAGPLSLLLEDKAAQEEILDPLYGMIKVSNLVSSFVACVCLLLLL